jgi:branched-chain amino acid transport system substrate-binding protein
VQAHPQVIFSQMEPPTAAVLTQNMKELDNLAIPIVASDTSTAPEWITAVTPSVANKDVTSAEGATVNSPAASAFMKYFKKDYPGKQPLGSAIYAYDGTIVLALAIDMAGSTNGPTYAKDIKLVASPPGVTVYDYATGLADINAHKDINYDGAGTTMDYNSFHNVFGPFELVKSDLSGNLQVVATITGAQIAKAVS